MVVVCFALWPAVLFGAGGAAVVDEAAPVAQARNIVADAGFEQDPSGWQLGIVGAERRQDCCHAEEWALRLGLLRAERWGDQRFCSTATVQQSGLPLVAEQPYDISLWINGDGRGITSLAVYLDPGNGAFRLFAVITDPPAGWYRWNPGSFLAAGAEGRIVVTVPGHLLTLGECAGGWYIDDVAITAMIGDTTELEAPRPVRIPF